MSLEPYLQPERAFIVPSVESRDDLFTMLSQSGAAALGGVSTDELRKAMSDRERLWPTGTPEGVAFPHALLPQVNTTIILVGRVVEGVLFGRPVEETPRTVKPAAKKRPVAAVAAGSAVGPHRCDLILCMLAGAANPWDHVRLLARLARIVRSDEARAYLRAAPDAATLHQRLLERDRSYG